MDTYFVGTIKGVGEIHGQSVVGTNCSFGFARLHRSTSSTEGEIVVEAPSWITTVVVMASLGLPAAGWYVLLRFAVHGQRWTALVFGVFVALWLTLAATLSLSGFFLPDAATRVPRIAYSIIPVIVGYVLLARARPLRAAVDALPLHWMVGFQFYRVVGAVFLVLLAQGRLPWQFAIPAGLGDLAVGLAAPFVAALLRRGHRASRSLAILWNVAGVLDLLLAVAMGFLTSPGPFQLLARDTPNTMITAFPLVLVATIAVPFSILLHLLCLRRLGQSRRPAAEEDDAVKRELATGKATAPISIRRRQ